MASARRCAHRAQLRGRQLVSEQTFELNGVTYGFIPEKRQPKPEMTLSLDEQLEELYDLVESLEESFE
jgi:hypothetical protein